MRRIDLKWAVIILAAVLLMLYAVYDFLWVHLIHSDAVDPAR